jgi:HEAT repeat protein
VLALLISMSATSAFLFSQGQERASLARLISQFRSARGLAPKERLLNEITTNFPNAGPPLLELAETTTDVDTKWMAVRGIGSLKYEKATPFLVKSLRSDSPYVRANSARALGDIKAYSAKRALITLLSSEQDGGVIEQTSLALQMMRASEAVPVLKSKASYPSIQTRMWIFQAIGYLGSKDDVPFLAGHLYEKDLASMSAAQAIERIMELDFGFPKREGPGSPAEGLKNARLWWATHRSNWGSTSEGRSPKH